MKFINGTLVIVVLFIGALYALISGIHHETTVGEHTGYVTAVERRGLYFKTFRAYVKTDPQSSQEDEYCVVDPKVYSKLEELAQKKTQVTVSFNSWLISGQKNCAGEDAVIYYVIATAEISQRENEAKAFVEAYIAGDPIKEKQISDMKKAIFDVTGSEAQYSEIKQLLDSLNLQPTTSTQVKPVTQVRKTIDPAIKIEKCKTQAKNYADGVARRDYLLAFEKAQEAGDTQTAQFYYELSRKPEHPANYDSNYNSEYIKCLDN